MNKPSALTVLKTLAAAATAGAVARLGVQLAHGHPSRLLIVLTVCAVLGVGAAVTEDVARLVRSAHSHRRAVTFRRQHGDPVGWDDDEYEAYWAITAAQTSRRNIQTAA